MEERYPILFFERDVGYEAIPFVLGSTRQ